MAKLYVCFVFEAATRLPTESWRWRTARGVAARSSASDATASLFTDAPQASTRSIVRSKNMANATLRRPDLCSH